LVPICTAAQPVSVLKLKTTWRGGTTHLLMSPMELMLEPQTSRSRSDYAFEVLHR